MLGKRIITSLVGIPVVVVAVWFADPVPWFTVLAAICGLLAIYEFYKLTSVIKVLPLAVFGVIWTLLLIIQPHWGYSSSSLVLSASAIVLSLVIRSIVGHAKLSVTVWLWSVVGIFYVGLLLSYLVSLRLDAGSEWVYLVIFCTFGSDTMAYFVGKAVGKHKMAPRISPGKTWEGAVAGLCGAVIVSLLFMLPTPAQIDFSWWLAILLGLLISVAGQVGDLAESLLKRRMGTKESGVIMPGHGGILDRLDSILLAGVAVYVYYTFAVA